MSDYTIRRERITTLLEHYNGLIDPMQSRNGTGDGEHLPLMPPTYSASVRELERLLRVMRDDRAHPLLTTKRGERVSLRACWWHINEWYIRAYEVMVTPAKTPRRNKRRELRALSVDSTGTPLKQKTTRRNIAARLEVAQTGVAWMADNWGHSEVWLPVISDDTGKQMLGGLVAA